MGSFSVKLKKIVNEYSLEEIFIPQDGIDDLEITSSDVNRPGLNLSGYFDFFDAERLNVFGNSEMGYIDGLTKEDKEKRIKEFFSHKPPAVIITRGIDIDQTILKYTKKYNVPLFRTSEATSSFLSSLISTLNVELAPRITRHGVLVEVYGEGVLLLGESGVGKSETAVELVKRGHRLIADDAVEIRRVSNRTLVGASPDNIRHFLELRGIGIVNARRIFGIGAVKVTEKIDLVVQLELWNPDKTYDRLGMDNEYLSILGLKIPSLTIPVKPGRNLAIIIEVAAMNHRQKKMGYNAADELLRSLGMLEDTPVKEKKDSANWDLF